jgi:hypothetical protein
LSLESQQSIYAAGWVLCNATFNLNEGLWYYLSYYTFDDITVAPEINACEHVGIEATIAAAD